jgi:hypothetical protein
MASVAGEVKGGWSALKSHWMFFLVAIILLAGWAFKYDAEHVDPATGTGKIRSLIAGLPVVGNFFFPKKA